MGVRKVKSGMCMLRRLPPGDARQSKTLAAADAVNPRLLPVHFLSFSTSWDLCWLVTLNATLLRGLLTLKHQFLREDTSVRTGRLTRSRLKLAMVVDVCCHV